MRFSSLCFLLASACLGACAPSQYWVGGSVGYTTASSSHHTAGSSGALPLRVLYCPAKIDLATDAPTRQRFVRLGDGCLLDFARQGRTCDLPTEAGRLRVRVDDLSDTFTFHYGYRGALRAGPPLNVVVGGPTVDDERYVTYRFTGSEMHDATADECAAAARTLLSLPPPPKASTEVSEEIWSAWHNGKLDRESTPASYDPLPADDVVPHR